MNSKQTTQPQVAALLATAPDTAPNRLERLVPLIYDELRTMAHRQLGRGDRNHTLQTTALVHEAYFKLAAGNVNGRGRAYFFAAAAQAMRQVLVEHARSRNAKKRGGGAELVTLREEDASVDTYAVELLELDDALRRLARHSLRQVKVVEFRFFAGMSVEETAQALGVAPRTVEADWAMARAWLFQVLRTPPAD